MLAYGFPIINLWGARFTSTFSLFSVMAGCIAGLLFMMFYAVFRILQS